MESTESYSRQTMLLVEMDSELHTKHKIESIIHISFHFSCNCRERTSRAHLLFELVHVHKIHQQILYKSKCEIVFKVRNLYEVNFNAANESAKSIAVGMRDTSLP